MSETVSATVTGTLDLLGVWVHNPIDAQGTIKQFLYGKAQRSLAHETIAAEQHYAGREFPVVDFADYHDHALSVTVDIPNGDDWMTKVEELHDFESTHGILVLRDNRGRLIFGWMKGFQEQDTVFGTQTSFTFSTADYEQSVV